MFVVRDRENISLTLSLQVITDFEEKDPVVSVGNFPLTQLVMARSQRLLLAGCEDGSIRTYKYDASIS